MDTFSPEQRHRCMSNIRSKNTLPEILVRKRLFACGWRFRVCDKRLKGKPDIVIPKAKTIIDVRGCFWHRHGCKDSTMPKSNIAFWVEKWSKNVKRDHWNEVAWRDVGWNLIIVWQCSGNAHLKESKSTTHLSAFVQRLSCGLQNVKYVRLWYWHCRVGGCRPCRKNECS